MGGQFPLELRLVQALKVVGVPLLVIHLFPQPCYSNTPDDGGPEGAENSDFCPCFTVRKEHDDRRNNGKDQHDDDGREGKLAATTCVGGRVIVAIVRRLVVIVPLVVGAVVTIVGLLWAGHELHTTLLDCVSSSFGGGAPQQRSSHKPDAATRMAAISPTTTAGVSSRAAIRRL